MGNKKKVDDSDEDQQISDSATPASTQNSKGKNHLNEDKRKKAQQNLPAQKTVSDNIGRLYRAVQEKFIESLKNRDGAMYLGLDAWQSPNGFNILGTVIYQLVEGDSGGVNLEAMSLDFVQLRKSHTAVYLAETVRVIVEKFGIRDKICGIVTNNASNNETMINEIKSYKWPWFKDATWHKQNKTILTSVDQEQYSDKDDEDADPADPNDQIRMCTTGDSSDKDKDDDEDKLLNKESALASELISDNEIELEDEDLKEMSDKDKDNQYTSTSCKLTLAKVSPSSTQPPPSSNQPSE
ncbi:hypothetical protein MJO29_006255 [Puccinia striiformis f. sp. tritici]|nr:hypothetical protein MJO29_006255 [Puccinia striiformis f. sp. tritici]